MATLRQLHANRLNCLKSTGPKTAHGKDRARRNGLLHGLTASIVFPDEQAEAVGRRYAELESSLRPWNVLEWFYMEQVASLNVRLDRCKQQEAIFREQAALRALTCWDGDRAAEAAALGGGLARRPEEVVTSLRTTRHGCDWLAARWSALGRDLDLRNGWDEALRGRALDLLGIPPEERGGPSPLDPPAGADPADHRRALVADQLARLAALQADALEEADEAAREAATMGVAPDHAGPLALIRRYERSLERRLQWYLNQFSRRERHPSRRVETRAYSPRPEPPFPPEAPLPELDAIPAAAPPPGPEPEPEPEPAAPPAGPAVTPLDVRLIGAAIPTVAVRDRPMPRAASSGDRTRNPIFAARPADVTPNRQARRAAAAMGRDR